MVKKREEIAKQDCWNVEALYPNMDVWEKEFVQVSQEGKDPRWPEIEDFMGKLGDGVTTLKNALKLILGITQKLEKLYTYAHLRHDEDTANDLHRNAYARSLGALHDLCKEVSWFEPELLELPENQLKKYLEDLSVSEYRFHLEKIFRQKPHTLSKECEHLMAMSAKALQASQKAFRAINDADFVFGQAKDGEGNPHEITHAQYSVLLRRQDRELRKNAFECYHNKYHDFENTLCELVSGQMETHVFNARARKFNSALEAALFPHNIPPSVYHSLITAVSDNISSLHRYMKLRKDVLKLKELHMYDMYVPLTADLDMVMPYDEARDVIIESVAPLGDNYQKLLAEGLTTDRWVDKYENKNKRSGGYSSGCFDSMPYILMNYKDIIRDVFILAHEAGHSMHSRLSRLNQPYHYADYPIFVAEVASTFNEELLTQKLLKICDKRLEKIFLINQKLEDIRGTLFRQTMFAEFELTMHEMTEKGIPLTPTLLKEQFIELNKKYFGDDVLIDDTIAIEWARIPHFYFNFYVYQYATGISAALTLADIVQNGGASERDAYLTFLKGGCSKYPIDLLKAAGVDMTSPEPVITAIKKFDRLIDELESLLKEPAKV